MIIVDVKLEFLLSVKAQWFRMSIAPFADKWCYGKRHGNIDLENIKQLQFVVQATPSSGDVGGVIEIHLDSPDGKLIGRTEIIESKDIDYARLMENMGGAAKPKKSSGVKVDTSKQKQAPPIDFEAIMKLLAVHAIAPIAPVKGLHNLYFVFRNKKAAANQLLMQVEEIDFQNKVAPPPDLKQVLMDLYKKYMQ